MRRLAKLAMAACLVCLLAASTACAGLRENVRRHPAAWGAGSAAVVTLAIVLATRHPCPRRVNGYPYDGTPPCPNPATYDPGPKSTGKHAGKYTGGGN